MSTDPLLDDEYASEDDSDFALDDAAPRDASDASDSEDDDGEQAAVAAQPSAKRKRAAGDDAEDDGYDNSGDEAIISKGKKKQKKRNKGKDDAAAADDDDEGGEGGLVKTRSMRANEKAERRVAAASGPVTVDVDDLWARMMAGPIVPPKASVTAPPADATDAQQTTAAEDATNGAGVPQESTAPAKDPSGMIKIKRTYNFAGKVHTEEKVVPRDSAEAKVYLATLGEGADASEHTVNDEDEPTKRQPRRAFRSAFEPIITDGSAQRSDLNLGMAARLQMRETSQKAKKLNVVEKSRMDWAGFVDQEGIKDELELAGKSKQSYASRQDFLARVEANRDEDARRIRMAGRA